MFRIRSLVSSPFRAVLHKEISPLTLRPISAVRFNTTAMSTISDAVIKDHRELQQYYNEITNSSDHDHQDRFGNQFTWELARHSVAEELIVYPALEKHMGEKGQEMTESDRRDHHQVSMRNSSHPYHSAHCPHWYY